MTPTEAQPPNYRAWTTTRKGCTPSRRLQSALDDLLFEPTASLLRTDDNGQTWYAVELDGVTRKEK